MNLKFANVYILIDEQVAANELRVKHLHRKFQATSNIGWYSFPLSTFMTYTISAIPGCAKILSSSVGTESISLV